MIFKEENRIRTINVTLTESEKEFLRKGYKFIQAFSSKICLEEIERVKIDGTEYSDYNFLNAESLFRSLVNAANYKTFKIECAFVQYDDDEENNHEEG